MFHFVEIHRDGMLELGTPEVEPGEDEMFDDEKVEDPYRREPRSGNIEAKNRLGHYR